MDIKIESDEEADFIGFATPKERDDEEVAEAIALAKQLHVYKPGIEFVPGSKLEVLEARDNNWYLCKVVEVDWGELDILVHYDKWSVRFDEWLKMDSTRIRPAKIKSSELKRCFSIKEKVTAYWAPDGRYYTAEIVRQLSDDCWTVLFYDGFTKSLRRSHIRKFDAEATNPLTDYVKPKAQIKIEPHPGEPSIKLEEHFPVEDKSNIFKVKIMEEKRKGKKNPAVEKLFQSIRKRRRSEREDDEEIHDKPIKRFKPTNEVETRNLETRPQSLDYASSTSDSSAEDTSEYESDSSDSVESSITSTSPFTPVKNNTENTDSETIKIGSFLSSYHEEQNHTSSYSESPLSSSTDELGFKGFDSASLSAEKYRLKETLSSLLGLALQEDAHLCPKKGCGKSFRKESLLHMHMKHYHPRLGKLDRNLPIVAEVTYPRKVEHPYEDAAPSTTADVKKVNAVKTEDSKKLNMPSHNRTKDSPSKISIEAKRSYISALKRKIALGDKTNEFRNRKNRKPAEIEEITPDSPDKSDSAEKSDPDAIINCRCGFREEDGLMLQCDICLCWQHGSCYHIENEEQVPNSYICSICENSYLQRPSRRFRHHQDWLKEGKLPRFSGSAGSNRLESMIRTCHELMGNVLSVSDVMHSLNLKLYISKRDDHPKLVMWHKKWRDEEETTFENDCAIAQTPDEATPVDIFNRGKDSLSADDKYVYNGGNEGQLQDIDRVTHDRFKGTSPQDGINKVPADKNDFPNGNEADENLSHEKGVLKVDPVEQNSGEGLIIDKKAYKSDDKKDEGNFSGEKKETYSDWKDPSLESSVSHKIKVEEEEQSEAGSVGPEVDSVGPTNLESRTNEDTISDSQKEGSDDEVFDFALPGLVSGANVSSDLTDLLSSNVELERFVHQASTELAPMDNQPALLMQRAPIIPQAERILPVKCKLNLLDHIEKMQDKLFDRFDLIEDHIQALESEMGLTSKFSKEEEEDMLCNEASISRDEITLQARSLVRMSLRDLETATKLINYTPS